MSSAGYNAVVERVGTSTAFTNESMSATSVANQYQIDDAAKRVWDRNASFTFFEDTTQIPSSDVEEIDYVFGKVTFATAKTGAITVDGSYLPRQAIAGANSYSLEHTGDVLDDTDFDAANGNGGFRTRIYGLRDVSATIERYHPPNKHYTDALVNGEVVVLSVRPGGANDFARGFFVVDTDELDGDVAALEGETLNLRLDGDPGIAYGWGT